MRTKCTHCRSLVDTAGAIGEQVICSFCGQAFQVEIATPSSTASQRSRPNNRPCSRSRLPIPLVVGIFVTVGVVLIALVQVISLQSKGGVGGTGQQIVADAPKRKRLAPRLKQPTDENRDVMSHRNSQLDWSREPSLDFEVQDDNIRTRSVRQPSASRRTNTSPRSQRDESVGSQANSDALPNETVKWVAPDDNPSGSNDTALTVVDGPSAGAIDKARSFAAMWFHDGQLGTPTVLGLRNWRTDGRIVIREGEEWLRWSVDCDFRYEFHIGISRGTMEIGVCGDKVMDGNLLDLFGDYWPKTKPAQAKKRSRHK